MKFNNTVLFILIILTIYSCDNDVQAPTDLLFNNNIIDISENLGSKSERLPFFNIKLSRFYVIDQDSNASSPTLEDNRKARYITVTSKKRMLDYLDIIRFTLNTPEFRENLLDEKVILRSARTTSGPLGSIKKNDVYNKNNVLYVLENVNYNVEIRKGQIPLGAAAVGVVGNELLYLYPKTNAVYEKYYWIAFPNRENWDVGGYLNTSYFSGLILHEILHNMGFTHGASDNDTVYWIQGIFKETYDNKNFQDKYKDQLKQFMPYYSVLHADELESDTYPVVSKKLSASYITTTSSSYADVCLINTDGSYKLLKSSDFQ